jgi:hypothetical protein
MPRLRMCTVNTIYINQSAPNNLIMCTSHPVTGFSRKLMYPLNGIAIAQLPGLLFMHDVYLAVFNAFIRRDFFQTIIFHGSAKSNL